MSSVTPPRRPRASTGSRLRDRLTYPVAVYALVLVWGVGDVASTVAAAGATGSPGLELNPLMRILLATDPLLVPLVKLVVVTVAGLALFAWRDVVEQVPGWRAWFATMTGIGSLVVCNNLLVAVAAVV
jgi:hypothetical protein